MSNLVLKQNLIDARQLISDIDSWTQGDHATDGLGLGIKPTDDAAMCWCADGAILKVTETDPDCSNAIDTPEWYECSIALRDAAWRLHPETKEFFYPHVMINDCEVVGIETREAAHAAILAVFDDAIANA